MTDQPGHIVIGIGANLAAPPYASPRETCEAAIAEIHDDGLTVLQKSGWYGSAPVPASSQPWFVNGVIAVQTMLAPDQLLARLFAVEDRFGRRRGQRNAARTLDLDLIAYGDLVVGWDRPGDGGLMLPHARMHERGFVLLPLRDIAPGWRHPALLLRLDEMIAALDPEQQTVVCKDL